MARDPSARELELAYRILGSRGIAVVSADIGKLVDGILAAPHRATEADCQAALYAVHASPTADYFPVAA